MIILIGGSSHTGKTYLSQKLLEKYNFPYISIDHLKMGLIRSGMTNVNVEEDEELTKLMWPILREMIKTMIENEQNAIIEGCYIPYDWLDSFDEDYLEDIECFYLAMSENYIEQNFDKILAYGSVIENRGEHEDITIENVKKDNAECLDMCKKHGCRYILIDDYYDINKIVDSITVFCYSSGI